jgi:hypothetical protein
MSPVELRTPTDTQRVALIAAVARSCVCAKGAKACACQMAPAWDFLEAVTR